MQRWTERSYLNIKSSLTALTTTFATHPSLKQNSKTSTLTMSLTTRLPFLFLVLIALTISALAADSILPTSASSTFPQCGLTCTTLTTAQTSCQAADASTWTSCFCQSSLLTGLKTSGSVCSTCSTADQATLSTWYNNYCNSGGKDTSKPATTTSSAAAGSTSGSSSSATTNKSGTTTEENKSWYV